MPPGCAEFCLQGCVHLLPLHDPSRLLSGVWQSRVECSTQELGLWCLKALVLVLVTAVLHPNLILLSSTCRDPKWMLCPVQVQCLQLVHFIHCLGLLLNTPLKFFTIAIVLQIPKDNLPCPLNKRALVSE